MRTTDPSSSRIVVFADILGFAALTEANPIDVQMLNAQNRPLSMTIESILKTSKNPLTETFSRFHNSIQWAIETAEMSHPLTAVTFSDSAFIATNFLFEATSFATDLALSALSQKIPIRMGIAYGSFAAVRFRSDISAEGGNHAAQFLGTAVVRAHEAETCGIKGMRILLHPSVESLLTSSIHCPTSLPIGTYPIKVLECSDIEQTNKINLRYELNYWNLAAGKESDSWHGFQDMWNRAADSHKEHYQATAEAINRMRMDQGEVSLTNLRRRTLPRRK